MVECPRQENDSGCGDQCVHVPSWSGLGTTVLGPWRLLRPRTGAKRSGHPAQKSFVGSTVESGKSSREKRFGIEREMSSKKRRQG